MNRKRIVIVIAADGTCTVDALHFVGPACQLATREIAQALGGPIQSEHDKPEIRLRESNRQPDREAAQ